MISFLFSLSCAKEGYLYFNNFNTIGPCMFQDHWWIRPGLKFNSRESIGGAYNHERFYAKSELEAKSFFKSRISSQKDYDYVVARLKYPKYRTQLNTMSGSVENLGGTEARGFSVGVLFISWKKLKNNYVIVFAKFNTSCIGKTFLYDRAGGDFRGREKKFDVSRRWDKNYIDEVYKYVSTFNYIIDAPYPVLISAQDVEEIYAYLNKLVAAERDKFIKITNYYYQNPYSTLLYKPLIQKRQYEGTTFDEVCFPDQCNVTNLKDSRLIKK